jgi:hypothetical protein
MMREPKRVEVTHALTSKHLRPGMKILNEETNRVKFDRNVIVTSEATNRDQFFFIDDGEIRTSFNLRGEVAVGMSVCA